MHFEWEGPQISYQIYPFVQPQNILIATPESENAPLPSVTEHSRKEYNNVYLLMQYAPANSEATIFN